jgi:lipoic acid synthetase
MIAYKPKVKAPNWNLIQDTAKVLQKYHITTVCQESSCPNRTECYSQKSATFMILGDVCTRTCRFCGIKSARYGKSIDISEPKRIAKSVDELGLEYVVLTSVDRDDLSDFGASVFIDTIDAIKDISSTIKVEILTPDFQAKEDILWQIVNSKADKLAHNEETTKRLSKYIRPQSDYNRSLKVLEFYAKNFKGKVKSSLMVGLGESQEELIETMYDLYNAGVNELTIGQYLQPSPRHHKVVKYYHPQWFEYIKQVAYKIGFEAVGASQLMRSSYHAKDL